MCGMTLDDSFNQTLANFLAKESHIELADPVTTDVKRGDIVEIAWDDAWVSKGYYDPEDYEPEWPRFAWGVVVAVSAKHITIAQDYNVRDEGLQTIATIPLGIVTGIKVLSCIELPESF